MKKTTGHAVKPHPESAAQKPRKEHGIATSAWGIALREEIGRNIKEARLRRNVSPAKLAEKAGVSVPQIYNIEAGSCSASLPVLYILAGLLEPRRVLPFVSGQFAARRREGK